MAESRESRVARGIAAALTEQRDALSELRRCLKVAKLRVRAADREFVRAVEALPWDAYETLFDEGWYTKGADDVIDVLADGEPLARAPSADSVRRLLLEDRETARAEGAYEEDVVLSRYVPKSFS